MPRTLEDLAPYMAGTTVENRINLKARSGSVHQGLSGYSQRQKPAPEGKPALKRQPSVAELLLANAGVWMPKQEPGRPIMSLTESGDDYVNINDLPPELAKVVDKNGRGLVGIQPSKIPDDAQRALFQNWIAAKQIQREKMLAQEAQQDPRFRQQLAALPPEE